MTSEEVNKRQSRQIDYGLQAASSDLYAAASGYGEYCDEGIPTEAALLALLAAFAVSFGVLYRASTTNAGRKKRELTFMEKIQDLLWTGLEDFENKIDKIASGVDNDEGSWINQIYHQFSGNSEAANETFDDAEGLEPPMLDETWGLKDGDEEQQPKKFKRNAIDDTFKNDIEAIRGEDSSCKTKLWRCFSKVAEGGLHYFDSPQGISGVIKSHLFKIGFQGAFGNVWNAVMSIPEARQIKMCMAANDECTSKEILRKESNSESDRILVNPDFVENLDQSDGSEQYEKNLTDFIADDAL